MHRHEDAARGIRHDAAADLDGAALGLLEAGHAAQRAGLAAAARPEQRVALRRRDLEADAVDGVHRAVVDRE